MKRLFIIAVIGLSLAGCAKDKISPAESILLGCKAFGSTLASLAPLRADGTLNAQTIDVINRTKLSVDPICTGEAPDVDASVKSVAVDAGVKVLTAIAAQFLVK